jgi:hypothetical protein
MCFNQNHPGFSSPGPIIGSFESRTPKARFKKRRAVGRGLIANGRSSTEVTFKAILFAAVSTPSAAQGCHNDHGGSQNQPPSASPMIAAVPLAASAAVNRQTRAARSSWSVSERKRCQTTSGRFKLSDSSDCNLPVVTICSLSQSNRRPLFSLGADNSSSSGISTPRKAFGKASTIGPSRQTVAPFVDTEFARKRPN